MMRINYFFKNLFGVKIIAIVHMLVLPQIGGDFTDFSEKLDINVLLLSKENRMLQMEM